MILDSEIANLGRIGSIAITPFTLNYNNNKVQQEAEEVDEVEIK